MTSDLERELCEDTYIVGLGIKKSAESIYKFGGASLKLGFKVGSYLLESASIFPTRARKNYHFLLNRSCNDFDSKYWGIFGSLIPGAAINYYGIILSSGDNWKEALAIIAATNTISGLYEIGWAARNKRVNSQKPVEWEDVEIEE